MTMIIMMIMIIMIMMIMMIMMIPLKHDVLGVVDVAQENHTARENSKNA